MVEAATVSNATVFWAQRKRFVLLKIEARNLIEADSTIQLLPPNIVVVTGNNKINGLAYHTHLELWHDIWIEKSNWKVTDLCVSFKITKKWRKVGFWPRLLKEETKFRFLKIDWDRWEDPEYIDPKNLLGENIDLEDFDDISQDSDSEGEKDEIPEHLAKLEAELNKKKSEKGGDKGQEEEKKVEVKTKEEEDDEDSEEDVVPEHLRD